MNLKFERELGGLIKPEIDVWMLLSIDFESTSWNSSSDWEDSIAGIVLSVGSIAELDGDVKAFIWSVWSWIALSWFSCPSFMSFCLFFLIFS